MDCPSYMAAYCFTMNNFHWFFLIAFILIGIGYIKEYKLRKKLIKKLRQVNVFEWNSVYNKLPPKYTDVFTRDNHGIVRVSYLNDDFKFITCNNQLIDIVEWIEIPEGYGV